ncbi:hypothetical protein CYMTET_14626 [Cymbomonas tetramitiformis]|uniref:Uncharacterized protein n=1 Tax=Cymbomonas tetramitiformis TaxID=36881 RepID=A0AAE0GFM8_9CHLO|nr:hypothetical protein CYMTET_14626 [Cymbomonas tetramitiformis]
MDEIGNSPKFTRENPLFSRSNSYEANILRCNVGYPESFWARTLCTQGGFRESTTLTFHNDRIQFLASISSDGGRHGKSSWENAEEQRYDYDAQWLRENERILDSFSKVLNEAVDRRKHYSRLFWYFLLATFHVFVLFLQVSSTETSEEVVSTMTLDYLPSVDYMDKHSEIMDWVHAKVWQIWTVPECGDFVCEEPYERPAYGRFGCKADCGSVEAVNTLVVEISVDFTALRDATIDPFALMQRATWNMCQTKEEWKKYGIPDECCLLDALEVPARGCGTARTVDALEVPARGCGTARTVDELEVPARGCGTARTVDAPEVPARGCGTARTVDELEVPARGCGTARTVDELRMLDGPAGRRFEEDASFAELKTTVIEEFTLPSGDWCAMPSNWAGDTLPCRGFSSFASLPHPFRTCHDRRASSVSV